MALGIMTAILLWPILAAGPIYLLGKRFGDDIAKSLTLGITILEVILSGLLLFQYWGATPDSSGFKLLETVPWIPNVGITYILGVDGLSLPC
ncbi:MAG: hypothetical protein ACFFBD_22210 [Candidatus Hodarchaeota archaeon]